MKLITVVGVSLLVGLIVGFGTGSWNDERLVKYRCDNDPDFSWIGGAEYLCVPKEKVHFVRSGNAA